MFSDTLLCLLSENSSGILTAEPVGRQGQVDMIGGAIWHCGEAFKYRRDPARTPWEEKIRTGSRLTGRGSPEPFSLPRCSALYRYAGTAILSCLSRVQLSNLQG